MASPGDIRRARLGARQAVRDLDRLAGARRAGGDSELSALLGEIGERKAAQGHLLWQWLLARDPAFAEAGSGSAAMPPSASPDGPPGPAADTRDDGAVEVIERRDVAPELLVFKVPRPADFRFRPGQSVKVELDGIRRSYSLVSAPHEPELEFFVELAPGGRMSERLRRLAVGDRLGLGTPEGSFGLHEGYRHHLMVATVTGVNPFVSMLRDCLHRGRDDLHLHLLHGASYQDEFGYREELEALSRAHPDLLTYVPTVSRPGEPRNRGWHGAEGRVDTLIDAYLARSGLDHRSTMLYACGNGAMVTAVAQRYRPRGFRVTTEDYD